MLLFRLALLSIGRFASNPIRRLLQRLLILGKRRAPLCFRRTVRFASEVTLIDEVWVPEGGQAKGPRLRSLYAGTDHTAIYVAMSQVFQESCFRPWVDYTSGLPALATTGHLRVERALR